MAQMIVRNLDEDQKVRQILRCAVNVEPSTAIKLGSRIAARFTDIGLDMPLPELHGQSVDPVTFER